MSAYIDRSMKQAREWVDAICRHNDIDDECCPDFSCCFPHLFEHDRAKRVQRFNEYAAKHNYSKIEDA